MANLSGTYVIWGPPGTGKTTLLAKQVDKIVRETPTRDDYTSPVSVCSLTRTAAAEIAGRGLSVKKHQIGTLHALAYRRLGIPPIAETMIEEWNDYKPEYGIEDDTVRENVDDMPTEKEKTGSNKPGTTLYADYCVYRAKMEDKSHWPARVKGFAHAWEDWKEQVGCIDFTDMIELALKDVATAPGNPDVLVGDEIQDLSKLELSLISKWGEAAGALLIAGDPWQSLYCWRGADPSIFNDPTIPESHRYVLKKSQRVPALVKELSDLWIEGLSDYKKISYEARDGDIGKLSTSDATWTHPEPIVDSILKHYEAGDSVMILATCSYMVRPIVQVLRKRGIPFCNPWRTRRGDWNPLYASRGVSMADRVIDFLINDKYSFPEDPKSGRKRHMMWTPQELKSWCKVLKSRGLLRRGVKTELNAILGEYPRDRELSPDMLVRIFTEEGLGSLGNCLDHDEKDNRGGGQTKRLLVWFKEHLLDSRKKTGVYPLDIIDRMGVHGLLNNMEPRPFDGKPHIFVGTIHSFKGAEADRVYIFPDLSPAGYNSWQKKATRDGVIRTFYVGITRAKKSLTICDSSSGMEVKLKALVGRAEHRVSQQTGVVA